MQKKYLSVALIFTVLLAMLPTLTLEVAEAKPTFTDMPDNWSKNALENAVRNGLLRGDQDKIMPDAPLTRAQMAAIVVRAFAAKEKGDISMYSDIRNDDWFAEDLARAFKMGIIQGYGNQMSPNDVITREQAFVVLARALKIKPAATTSKDFDDVDQLSGWAKEEVFAFVNSGHVQGSGGKLNPQAGISRAEFAQLIYNLIKQYINIPGVYTEVAPGNLMINAPNVTLKNVRVTGDLVIGDGVADGDVALDHVTIEGNLIVRGGGVDSVVVIGGGVNGKIVVAKVDGRIRVMSKDNADVAFVVVEDGLDDVIIEGKVGTLEIASSYLTVIVKNASVEKIEVKGAASGVEVAPDATIGSALLYVSATDTSINVEGKLSSIETRASGTGISGAGVVGSVITTDTADNTSVTTPNTIVSNRGASGVTAGGGVTVSANSTVTNNDSGEGIIQPPPDTGATSTMAQDNADIAAAVELIESVTYSAIQGDVNDPVNAKDEVEAVIQALDLNGSSFVVNTTDFTAAVEESVGHSPGTDGAYKFTVTVSKGLGAEQTTEELTMIITATPYDRTQDSADIAAAKVLIEISGFGATQSGVANEQEAKAKVELLLGALDLSGATASVETVSFTPAEAGTVPNEWGIDGLYKFRVEIGKGLGEPQTTEILEMLITATPYDNTQDNLDIGAAKAALEGGTLKPREGTDTGVVPMAEAVVAFLGVEVTMESSDNAQVNIDGTITYGESLVTGCVVLTLNKGLGDESTANVLVEVPAANRAPVGVEPVDSLGAVENAKFAIDLRTVFSDDYDDPEDLIYAVRSTIGASAASIGAGGWTLEYTPQGADIGEDTVKITVFATDTQNAVSNDITITLSVEPEFAGGTGTQGDPWQISTPMHLNNLRNRLGTSHKDKYYILNNDIDLAAFLSESGPEYNDGQGWRPIGGSTYNAEFRSHLDGNGKTISNLTINRGEQYVGLFGYTNGATVKDLTLDNVDVKGGMYTGSLCGHFYYESSMDNVTVNGTIQGAMYTGGIAGRLYSATIQNSSANVQIVSGSADIGGLVGYNGGIIEKCSAAGTVSGSGSNTGGFVGWNSGTINDSYSFVHVTVDEGGSSIGGFVGYFDGGSIKDCYSAGSCISVTHLSGGFVGGGSPSTTSCYYDATISERSDENAGSIPKTTSEMKEQSTFVDWDFVTVWDIDSSGNDGYPFLR